MASVSSLDKDLRSLRLGKYTPEAATEVRVWIEQALAEHLDPGDLLEALKDGVALCKWVMRWELEDLFMMFLADQNILGWPTLHLVDQACGTKNRECHLCKWRIFPIFSARANYLH